MGDIILHNSFILEKIKKFLSHDLEKFSFECYLKDPSIFKYLVDISYFKKIFRKQSSNYFDNYTPYKIGDDYDKKNVIYINFDPIPSKSVSNYSKPIPESNVKLQFKTLYGWDIVLSIDNFVEGCRKPNYINILGNNISIKGSKSNVLKTNIHGNNIKVILEEFIVLKNVNIIGNNLEILINTPGLHKNLNIIENNKKIVL